MLRIMAAFAEATGLSDVSMRFMYAGPQTRICHLFIAAKQAACSFDGRKLCPEDTAAELRLQENDVVDVIIDQ